MRRSKTTSLGEIEIFHQHGWLRRALTSLSSTARARIAASPQPAPELISVIVTLFNYGHFLEECLASVAAQDYQRLELIVVDDRSTDRSANIAEDWLKSNSGRFERAVLIRHHRNEGPAQARNTAFLHSRGDYIFILDADNSIYPRAIGRLHDAIESTESQFAYSQLELFGSQVGLGYADIWDPGLLARGNYIDSMSLVSRQAWLKVGGFSHIDFGWEDFDFWCKFAEHSMAGIFVPEILCRYRVHDSSRTKCHTNPNIGTLTTELTIRHPWLGLPE